MRLREDTAGKPQYSQRSLLAPYSGRDLDAPSCGMGHGARVEIVGAACVRLTLSPPASPRRPSFLLPSAPPPPRSPRSPLFVLSVHPRPDPGPAAGDERPLGRAGDIRVRGRGSARVRAGVYARLPVPLQGRSFAPRSFWGGSRTHPRSTRGPAVTRGAGRHTLP